MSYPGDPALDARIKQRILSAFAEAVRLYQEGSPEECRTVLRSILEVDPSFSPAARLMTSVDDGIPVDLGKLLGEVDAGGVDTETVLIEARQAFAERRFARAVELAREVLHELPGQEEAKRLVIEAEGRMRSASEVEKYVQRARAALKDGSLREVGALLELARNLDPSHPDLLRIEQEMEETPSSGVGERPIEFNFGEVAQEIEDEDTVKAKRPPAPPETPPEPAAISASPTSVPAAPSQPVSAEAGSGAPPAQAAVPPPGDAPDVGFAEEPTATEPPEGFSVDVDGEGGAPEFGSGEQFGFADAEDVDDAAERVESLLAQGQDAYDKGEFQGAIDAWSRIYLIQAENPEADRRLAEARQRLEEVQRRADHRFYEAREAFEQGRTEDARALCQEVLKLEPRHLEAQDLIARLDTPAAPPPPPAAAPVEEDLFHDDFVPAAASASSGEVAAVAGEATARETLAHRLRQRPAGRQFPLPLPALVLAGGLVVVLLLLGFVFRSTIFGPSGAGAETTIAQAQAAADQGRLREAIDLLNSLQASEQLDGDVANQVSQRIVSYQRRLKAAASPVPRVDLAPIREALEAGKRVKALRLVRAGLAKVPGDSQLTAVKGEILSYSPLVTTLADAVDRRDNETVRRAAQELQRKHPGDSEASRLWRAATFNEAIILLRKYQVGSAKGLLDQLADRDGDPEVERVRTFAGRYISKPVDPRYQIFVTNVELRPLE